MTCLNSSRLWTNVNHVQNSAKAEQNNYIMHIRCKLILLCMHNTNVHE